MRLLDVRTLELKSFFDDIPPYAILSHCWEDDEVLYTDIKDIEKATAKKGFQKIQKTCERAIADELDYCWVDTCCIDKSSSAELSEAINSMFNWYKESRKCYAYLADVEGPHDFEHSKWFTRSWTLQELLAPSSISSISSTVKTGSASGMDFFSCSWKNLGSKGGLSTTISKVTGVDKEYLEGKSLNLASISMRMSWAADRRATRAEDIAYSLLGIFDVNMPLLYGEGKLKAFRRLQEEIMKISEDETLFAWESTVFAADASSADVLASDPKDFTEAGHLVPFASDEPVAPYSLTHRGLRIWLQLFRLHDPETHQSVDLRNWVRPIRSPVMIWSSNQDLLWAPLRCHVAHDFHNYVMIPLQHVAANIYTRDTSTNVALVPVARLLDSPTHKEIFIRNSRTTSISNVGQRQFGILVRHLPPEFSVGAVVPGEAWDSRGRILQGNTSASGRRSWHASLQLKMSAEQALARPKTSMFLSLGCTQDGGPDPKPWCFLDDFVYTSDDLHLASFHDTVYSLEFRDCANQPRDCDDMVYNFNLKVKILTQRILGQRMFVVDIEYERNTHNLHLLDHHIGSVRAHADNLNSSKAYTNKPHTSRDDGAEAKSTKQTAQLCEAQHISKIAISSLNRGLDDLLIAEK